MSYATIHQAVNDQELIDRVVAAANKEAWASPEFSATAYGAQLREYPQDAINTFMWPTAIDIEADYQFAIDNGTPNPGGADVISDLKVQAAIQAHWPPDVTAQ